MLKRSCYECKKRNVCKFKHEVPLGFPMENFDNRAGKNMFAQVSEIYAKACSEYEERDNDIQS